MSLDDKSMESDRSQFFIDEGFLSHLLDSMQSLLAGSQSASVEFRFHNRFVTKKALLSNNSGFNST